jgi:hypothetical protein
MDCYEANSHPCYEWNVAPFAMHNSMNCTGDVIWARCNQTSEE